MHLINARRLASSLAKGEVTAKEQMLYLIATAATWILPYYFFVIPTSYSDDAQWFWMMWSYEFVLVVLIHVIGYLHCLSQCTIDPQRNFMIDFCCLWAPVSIVALSVAWGAIT